MSGITLTKPAAVTEKSASFPLAASVSAANLLWLAFASSLIPIGLMWDYSWENTIGIDRFWSPPHLAVNVGVWLSGILSAWLILKSSLARHRSGQWIGIKMGPLAAPSGAWILLWGTALFQLALPLDNWWQQTYGLGAGLWHPPQILKTVAFVTILFGGVALCATAQSRTASMLLVWQAGLLLTMCTVILTTQNYPNWQHGAWFYKISCAIYPAVLILARHVSRHRWSPTRAALVYMILGCAMVWLLPLFPARPLTAPIHNPTDHMMPPPFPLLLLLPALALDFLSRSSRREEAHSSKIKVRASLPRLLQAEVLKSIAAGGLFAAVFFPTQWFFATFLLSPSADNWFFAGGGKHWPFFLKIDQARVMFWNAKQDPMTMPAILIATTFAVGSSWIGFRIGSWLNKLRR